MPPPSDSPRVGLFVTCLVDFFRPTVGFAAIALLEQAGCTVEVPELQSCCGQPAFNSGDQAGAKAVAETILDAFAGVDYVVVPSGSCAGMISHYLPELFSDDPSNLARAKAIAEKTFELVSFLVDVRGLTSVEASLNASATYHDSCSGLRELGIKTQPRTLLHSVQGLTVTEMKDSEVCCGFGGTFCVKYPAISEKMVGDKSQNIADTEADLLLAGDLGCLLNMAGKLSRDRRQTQARHVAEVLADMTDGPAIGEDQPTPATDREAV